MRLSMLHLENFRVYRNVTIQFGKASFVVFRGANWSGKSTIRQALEMLVTPTTDGLDAKGNGFINKIKRGEARSDLVAHLQTKHHLVERRLTLTTKSTGRSRRTVCLSDPNWDATLFDRQLEDRRAALSVVLNTDAFLRMDAEEQKNLLAGLALPRRYEFDPAIVTDVGQALGGAAVKFDGEPFAVINQAYKKLYDERQVVNRQVREFVMPESLNGAEWTEDSRALEGKLTGLRVERKVRMDERDRAVSEANKQEITRARIKSRIQSLEEKIDAGHRRVEEMRQKTLLMEPAMCPTCGQPVDLIRSQAWALDELHAEESSVEEYQRQLEHIKTTLPETHDFDFAPYDTPIAALDQQIEELSARLRPVIAAEERKKEIEVKQVQLAELEKKAATLDRLVRYFDKNGIKARLIGEYIGGFEQKINEVMSAWGYKCALSIEPYSFEVTNARDDTIPVRELSGAERVMFLAGFQCAVARSSGIGLVVIDEVSTFLPEIREVLYMRLLGMVQEGHLDQVILLVADTSNARSHLPGVAIFEVKDGAVERLAA